MHQLDRRSLLRGGAATAAGLALAGPFSGFVAQAARGGFVPIAGYGPLQPTPDERDGVVRLDLPADFHYRTFQVAGTTATGPRGDFVLPGRHDGMNAFRGRSGRVILIRNHEINGNTNVPSSDIRLGSAPGYDPLTKGGTVTVDVDRFGNVESSFVSLTGTQMNCAGGGTPWRTWLSCEETVNGDDVGPDFTMVSNEGLRKHGYIFEVPTDGVSNAEPIRSAGRFAKEAAIPSMSGNVVYITEDSFLSESGFYRYLPPNKPSRDGFVADGGRLQMLAVVGQPNARLDMAQPPGATYEIEWVDIEDPDPDFEAGIINDDAIKRVGDEGRSKGAAIFSRLEGLILRGGRVYFTSTQGGAPDPTLPLPDGFGDGRGQVWLLQPGRRQLTLIYESPSAATLDLPDNITLSESGALVLCEDGFGDNFLRGLTPRGEIFDFARNADPQQVGQEFAGATFDERFRTMFVNIQSGPGTGRAGGYSIAIWGPWRRGPFG